MSTNNNEADTADTAPEPPKTETMFSLKKWNTVAMWSWDVECDTCAICRVQVMGELIMIYVYLKGFIGCSR